jgi:general secretion pathway protein N
MLAAAGLGALLWWDMQSAPETPDVIAPAAPPRSVDGRPQDGRADSTTMPGHAPGGETVNPLANLDKESLRDITQRPLFTPTRRPPPAPAPSEPEPAFAPPPAPPSTPDHILLGIVRDGDRAIALLRGRSDGRTLRVEAGDMVGGWGIASVDTVSVRLRRADGAAHELRLAPR